MHRIHKRKTAEKGERLIQKRGFARWTQVMMMDFTRPLNPMAVARSFYNRKLGTSHIQAWFTYVRERGRIARLRDKIFHSWQVWAPRNKKLKALEKEAGELTDQFRLKRSFETMTVKTRELIAARVVQLKALAASTQDRRVTICAFALMGFDTKVSERMFK